MKKNIFDSKHVKGVKAWALLSNGEMAGKVVANYSDNPMGTVCSASVIIWSGQLKDKITNDGVCIGKAGGYGYDKFSAACDSAIRKMGLNPGDMNGRGAENVKAFLEKNGYTVLEVI
jgi:hypothetical protein